MEIIQFTYQDVPAPKERFVLCLGYFDAIHLGHQKIIEEAKKSHHKVAVMTFDEPPVYVLHLKSSNLALTSNSDKAEILESLGVDYLYILHFDLEVAKLSRYEFIDKVLKVLNPFSLYCGEDYRFGDQALGNPTYLSQYFKVNVIPLVFDDDKKISSTNIAHLIREGFVDQANKYMNRHYRICGLVRHGEGNGTKFGFPTANIEPDYPYVMPKDGVYMGYGIYNDQRYKAIITVGIHPTINPLKNPIVEIHMLDFDLNIYGQYIFIEFVSFMRENKRFPDVKDLISQLKKDKEKAKKTLQ